MFGTNPLRKATRDDGRYLIVVDVFATIQGEGPFTGMPAVFVRLAGCNLKCHFCDTDFENGARRVAIGMLTEEVIGRMPCGEASLVVITGGEPLRQEVGPFIEMLLRVGFRVQIETAGTLWPTLGVPTAAHIVCSPKTGRVQPEILERCNDWKYIVGADDELDDDFLPMSSTQQAKGPAQELARPPKRPGLTIWIAPRADYIYTASYDTDERGEPTMCAETWANDDERNAANTKRAVGICMTNGYRLSLQTHKMIGMP
jgi:7-carboxy-7-deazaguanine synthase